MHKMIVILLVIVTTLETWGMPTSDIAIHGKATYMNDGIMRQVINNRRLPYSDGVALNRVGDLGREVWLIWGDGSITGPLPIVDCAQQNHYLERERQGRVVEVSAKVARERGFYGIGPVGVTVLFELPKMVWD